MHVHQWIGGGEDVWLGCGGDPGTHLHYEPDMSQRGVYVILSMMDGWWMGPGARAT